MTEATVDKFENVDYERLSTPFVLDLIEIHKLLEQELMELTEKVKNGMNEEELMKEIDNIFGGEE